MKRNEMKWNETKWEVDETHKESPVTLLYSILFVFLSFVHSSLLSAFVAKKLDWKWETRLFAILFLCSTRHSRSMLHHHHIYILTPYLTINHTSFEYRLFKNLSKFLNLSHQQKQLGNHRKKNRNNNDRKKKKKISMWMNPVVIFSIDESISYYIHEVKKEEQQKWTSMESYRWIF